MRVLQWLFLTKKKRVEQERSEMIHLHMEFSEITKNKCVWRKSIFALIFTLFPIHDETASDAVATVFEKTYIFYYRFVAYFPVNFLVAFLAQNNKIQQPKQH
jgi:hypothetical protein